MTLKGSDAASPSRSEWISGLSVIAFNSPSLSCFYCQLFNRHKMAIKKALIKKNVIELESILIID